MFSLKVVHFKEFYACLVFLMFISSGTIVCLALGLLVCVCVRRSGSGGVGGGLFLFAVKMKNKQLPLLPCG